MPLIIMISNQLIYHNYLSAEFNCVSYKSMYLKIIQDSYRICNWISEKQFINIDDVFTIDSFVDKIVCFIIALTIQPNYLIF